MIPEETSSPNGQGGYLIEDHILGDARFMKVICIGAGPAGLNLAYQVRRHLQNTQLTIYEKNSSLGGTWFENKYPGCACDNPSHVYQFEWAPNPDWSMYYSPAPEILHYLEKVARDHDLEQYINVDQEITQAQWLEEKGMWRVTIFDRQKAKEKEDWCHMLVNGSGVLNHWRWPDISGLKSFEGSLLHSAQWDTNADWKDKRVAVIGNGSSGIQLVTALQPKARHLTTFIRNPTWIATPLALEFAGGTGDNFSYTKGQRSGYRNDLNKYAAYRKAIEASLNENFAASLQGSPEQIETTKLITAMMRARLGNNHALADRMIPAFSFGCRRPTPGTGYLEALNEPNVSVEWDSIDHIFEKGIRLKTGKVIELDVIVCATGFDTTWIPRFPITGRGGANLAAQWKNRPCSYLSFAVHNFPNYFIFLGPNSPLSHGSVMPTLEHYTKYLLRLIHKMQTQNYKAVEPREETITDFIEHSDTFMKCTVWSEKCRSWLKAGTVDGPPLSHPGSRLHWFAMLQEPRWEDWKWTLIGKNSFSYLGNGFCSADETGRDKAWYMANPDLGYESIKY